MLYSPHLILPSERVSCNQPADCVHVFAKIAKQLPTAILNMERWTKALPSIFWHTSGWRVQRALLPDSGEPKINMSRNQNLPLMFTSPAAKT
jgi:hypothetical protein